MSNPTTLEALRRLEFFHDIAEDDLSRLAEIAREVEFPADSEMFHEYDTARDVFAVVSGKVSIAVFTPKFGWRQLVEVGDGELIGWSPLVGRDRLFDTARAITPTKALAFDGRKLLDLCRENPAFGFEFMHRAAKVLAQRLGATHSQLREITGVKLPSEQLESD
ncbi:MAG: Crp/Fnr family transcriptional regulator [Planctomycetota bacterium]|nr:MAG: Crp/Fnr family transcriptional regulator [Planctomycetota bacterium]REJ94944.1 MAG: Crp/Fnr family transcriptional regulator [Planctomycetota bacterium]REK22434.1 MAG: Crp/Fnr family transcriptional regulator [Planctomycetota bacterium]REK34916.1 MAG: Crp/Fnr family transcriptional regulator [Planctomycetota bacterium]